MPIGDVLDKFKDCYPSEDPEPILRACKLAEQAHQGQKRDSGEPYVEHPVQVASILAGLEMDCATITAGILHDVVEDTDITIERVAAEFGSEVASLVDGVTKLSKSDLEALIQTEEADGSRNKNREARRRAENLRKIFLAMAQDIRVMVIKLADRLHNMQTLDSVDPERQQRIAMETLQIYSPIAHRLGIWQIKWRLEDLSFKYLYPEAFEDIARKVAKTREEREHSIAEVIGLLQARLNEAGIAATIQGRPKHLWSIYQKMLKQEVDFNEIYDLTAVRIIVHTVAECYHALGIVHDLWIPIPGKFTDHISHPKSNMYQSLHTKVIGPSGEPLEIQIRTFEMHRTADYGVAAHWRYKEGGTGEDPFDRKLAWLRQQMFDWHTDTKDANEFLRSVTDDLFADQVFVFTPRGEVLDLPAGSTPVDFAYRVHSQIGDTCSGARVNGRIVPLSTPLKNGDIVQILTRPGSTPSFDWLSFVKSSHARSKIRAWFRKLRRAENVERGKDLLVKEGTRLGVDTNEVLKDEALERIARSLNLGSIEDLHAAVGAGTVAAQTVFNKLREAQPHDFHFPTAPVPVQEGKLNVAPGGVDQVLIRRSKCCQPLPGDPVLGYVSRGRGMVLHRQGCKNLLAYQQREPERLVPVEWSAGNGERFQVEIRIEAVDRVGLLNDIGAVFSETKTNIQQARISTNRDKTAVFNLTLDVSTVDQLTSVMANVQKLADVLDVYRLGAGNGKGGK